MSTEEATIETLKRWSHILLWISIVLPALGALAAGARYYVERYEKQLSSRLMANAVTEARKDASEARLKLAELEQKNAPRQLSPEQRATIMRILRRTKGNVQVLYPADTEAEVFAKKFSGQATYILSTDIPGKGTWYRVRLGDYTSAQEASVAKLAFERKFSVIAYVAGR